MRIAVITLHRVYNYGSILQTYAMQKIFEDLGFQIEIIDYITPQRTKKAIYLSCPDRYKGNVAKRLLYHILKFPSIILKELTFGRFLRKHINLTRNRYVTYKDLVTNCPNANIYVTGSDQTWNSQYNGGIDKGFFLDFVPSEKKRIAFVSSFGKTKLEEYEIEETQRLINKYAAISVREDSALSVLNQLGFSNGVCLIDPTLQITKEHWISLASRRLISEKYLILMILYNEDNHATEFARTIADEKGLKLVKISWELKRPVVVDKLMTHRSPSDFLSLFYYAEFVVTNSFHGLAFSINLNKQFIVVPRNEFNSRIESLLRITELSDRLVSSADKLEVAKQTIEFERINKILELERKRAKDFIIQNTTL